MSKHFELTGETLSWEGRTLHRIRATRDIVFHLVNEGDLGGWVENPDNLHDEAWVADEAKLCDNASMWDQSRMSDNSIMYGQARMTDYSVMRNDSCMAGYSHMSNGASMHDSAYMSDHSCMFGLSSMHDDSFMSGHSIMSGNSTMCGNSRLYGNASMSGDSYMSGNAVMSGDGEAASSIHILTGTIYTSHMMEWTLHRTRDGGHLLHIGCESGTLNHHQALCNSDTWIDTTDPANIAAARPEYQGVIDTCKGRISRWTS